MTDDRAVVSAGFQVSIRKIGYGLVGDSLKFSYFGDSLSEPAGAGRGNASFSFA